MKSIFKINNLFRNTKGKNFASTCKVDNPYTQKLHIEKPYVSSKEFNTYFDNAESAASFLESIPLSERISMCKGAMEWFNANRKEVATEITNSMGKPLIQSLREINGMIDRANVLCELSKTALEDDVITIDSTSIHLIKKEPIGISFMISPWNYPLLTVVNALVASILAGNPVILKHSVRTPIVGDFFAKAFKSVGATNVVQHLFAEAKDIPLIYKHKRINYVGFTGSVDTGKAVLKDISEEGRFIHSAFELGGKDPAYVREDADLKSAVEGIVDGAVYNSGQSCCSIERVYVHEKLYDDFIELAREEMSKITIGNPLGMLKEGDKLENVICPSMGPMALPDALSFLKEQIEKAGEEGAEIVFGGNITKDSEGLGRFFEPTLLRNCNNSMDIVRNESFGPILPVIKVSSDNEAIELMNDSEYGLTAAIYSKDYKLAQELGRKLDCGTVYLNRCDSLNPRLPWAGRKNSGVGIGLSKYGFGAFYKVKAYNFKLA